MKHLIDYVTYESDKMNIQLADNKGHIQVLDSSHIDSIVELYRFVYEKLKEQKSEKFLHPVGKKEAEELIESEDSVLVGYFKDGNHLLGVSYAKPLEDGSKYFKTPAFDEGSKSYIIGGLAVNPEFRGNGINPKLITATLKGLKHYSAAYPGKKIGGAGLEVSCENFSSLRCIGSVKEEDGTPAFNVVGMHYIENPADNDNDLTILGYNSFSSPVVDSPAPFNLELDGNQEHAYDNVSENMENICAFGGSFSKTTIDGHSILTFDDNFSTPMCDIAFVQ